MFDCKETGIEWLKILEPQIFGDERGFFMESYSKKDFLELWINAEFIQDNHSKSKAWVLRWLHFQTRHTQAKLVRVVSWSVYDVAVDLRKNSSTYGQYYGIVLSAENKKQFFIPKGFAHGFLTLEDNTEFIYKCDDYYAPEYDGGVHYNSLDIDWKTHYSWELCISEKDKNHPSFNDFESHNPF